MACSGRCIACGGEAQHRHHVLPKSVWPEHRDDPNCLVDLCWRCHQAWHDGDQPIAFEMLPFHASRLVAFVAPEAWIERWYPYRDDPTPF